MRKIEPPLSPPDFVVVSIYCGQACLVDTVTYVGHVAGGPINRSVKVSKN